VEQWKLSIANDTELLNAYEKGYLDAGFRGALTAYNKLVELRYKNSYGSPWNIASNYAFIGEKDKALYWLEQAFKVHDPNMPYLSFWPVWDSIHDDPRFQNLCNRMKLPYK